MATIRVRPVESKAKKDQMMDTDTTSESSLRSGVVIRIVVENNPMKQVPNSREKGHRTRSTSYYWPVGTSLPQLSGSGLPSNGHVLRRYLGLREENPSEPTRDLLRLLLNEMQDQFWIPSRIPTKDTKGCLDKLQGLVNDYGKVKKLSVDRRKEPPAYFAMKMDQLCDIAHSKAEQLIRSRKNLEWKSDLDFLKEQRKNAQMATIDEVLPTKQTKRNGRKVSKVQKVKENRMQAPSISLIEILEENEETESNVDMVVPPAKKKIRIESSSAKRKAD